MEFSIASFVVLLLFLSVTPADAAQPAHFVFGDSLLDSGNNNYLESFARADRYPYGIDYPANLATGRFSNGLNIADFISQPFDFLFFLIILSAFSFISSVTGFGKKTVACV